MKYLPLFLIILVAIVTRFWSLETLPLGFFVDEASQGYNAYSILKTGKDEYGEFMPILIRSFATFNPPLYTYLTIPVIYFFDLTIFSVRFLSAATGVGIVLLSFLLLRQLKDGLYNKSAIVFATCLALAPWGVFFSRGVLEPNLALFFFLLGWYLLVLAKTRALWLIPALLCFGLTVYSYSAYRIIVVLLLPILLLLGREYYLKNKKILLIAVCLLGVLVLPMIVLSFTPASSKRLSDLGYLNQIFDKYPDPLTKTFSGGGEFIYRFSALYSAYYSPRNLFFDPDPDPGKSIPELSVFYSWMVIPFFHGIYLLARKKKTKEDLLLVTILLVGPIPAALTRDPFASVRALLLLWSITLIISIGLTGLLINISVRWRQIIVIGLLISISCLALYRNYGVLFNFERSGVWMAGLQELATRIPPTQKAVVEQSRLLALYSNFLFFWKYPPEVYQQSSKVDHYYTDTSFSSTKNIGEVEFKTISWGEDFCLNQIVVGDSFVISELDVRSHKLTRAFEIKDPRGEVLYAGYQTNPELACPK